MASLAVLGLLLAIGDTPRTFALQAGVSVWDVASFDVNGDGRGDVLAACCDENSDPLKKFVAVYLADSTNAYPEQPSFTLDLSPAVSVLFPAETDGVPPKELIAADAETIRIYSFAGGSCAMRREIEHMSLFPTGSREPSFLKGAAQDLDGDGIDEWFVPMPAGFVVRNSQQTFARVRCDVDSDIRTGSGIRISNRYPAYYPFPQEGVSHKAIAFLSDEYADFAHGEGWSRHERFKIPINLGDKWDTSSDMEDINGDQIPDLIVTQTQGTLNLKALTQVYIAEGPMKYPEKPTATFESKGSFAAPILKDVNGDKKLDILFVNVPFGLKFFVNFFMFQKVGVDLQIYLFNGSGFGATPDYSTNISIQAPEGKEQSAYTLGDFNGDGRTDAAFGAGPDKMLFHAGGDVRFISSKPYLTLKVPAFGVARTVKLDNNAAEDIVIFHPGIKYKEQIEVLVF